MSEFDAVIDFGFNNLRIGVFDSQSKSIYSSKITMHGSFNNKDLNYYINELIRDAERHLSTHLENVKVLYDSSKFKFIELSIKKSFDQPTSIKKQFENLIEEANFLIQENHFEYKIIHLIINSLIIDDNKKLKKITDKVKSKSLILELKFICLGKSIINNIFSTFKKNSLNISNIFCSSYVKATFYNKKFKFKNNLVFLDIGFERTTAWFFIDHKFVFFNSINLGGNSITKDISNVLDLDMDYSENLKKNFDIDKNDFFNRDQSRNINLFSEIQKKNISIDKLKNIIQARVDEIIELAVYKNNYFKDTNNLEIQSLIFIGSGSKLLSNNTNFESRKLFQELIFLKENELTICNAGLNYNKSEESQLVFSKKKTKKEGFFERFFNFFSK